MRINELSLFEINDYPVDCNLNLTEGITVLLGKNGIGKSSFFHYLKTHKSTYFNQSVAFMDQFPLHPMLDLRGSDILQIMLDEVPDFKKEIFDELVDRFKFDLLLDQIVTSYSGGENQIFKFILMRAQDAQINLMDEPFQYLDDINSHVLSDCIKSMSDKKVLIIEHHKEKLRDLKYKKLIMEKKSKRIQIQQEDL